jgi:hypothetical protein
MPFTKKAKKYFEAVAHGMKPTKGKLSKHMADKLADEGTKDSPMEEFGEDKRRKKAKGYIGK